MQEAERGAAQQKPSQSVNAPINSESQFQTVKAPSIALPKGGGAIRSIGEKFAANPVTGTGSMSVPIATSPGRNGFGPQLSLSYDSGAGNGLFGLGWSLALPSITRKTDKGLPRYLDEQKSDEFILSGAEDLVPVLVKNIHGDWERKEPSKRYIDNDEYSVQRFRPRIEGLFSRIEYWTNTQNKTDTFWRSISKENITTWYGKTSQSRIYNPENDEQIFSWLICESYDDKGNVIVYNYEKNDVDINRSKVFPDNRPRANHETNRYIKYIKYGNRTPYYPELKAGQPIAEIPKEWLFTVLFDYGEGHYQETNPVGQIAANELHKVKASASKTRNWSPRPDPFSQYRAGFEIRTERRCQRVLMFHQFDELGDQPYLVRSTEFDYRDLDYNDELKPVTIEDELSHHGSTRFLSTIQALIQSGYERDETANTATDDDNQIYIKESLPPLEFTYTKAAIDTHYHSIDQQSLENLPQGLDGSKFQWVDLDGEGAGGILTDQGGAWYYKRNLSPLPINDGEPNSIVVARFAPLESITSLPSQSSLSSGAQRIMDLAGDGETDVVTLDDPAPGFYERTQDGNWKPRKNFKSVPNINWQDPNLKFVDLTGDGFVDIFITENEAFIWYASLAEEGFSAAQKTQQALNEEDGPRLVFADGTDSIYLADMSGDGLSDIVRIRNGEVCYWPNLGYCRFGYKITLINSPHFDTQEQFDQKRIRLADIDGSGTNDILYLQHDGVDIYFNQSGNRLASVKRIEQLPPMDNFSNILTIDLLGNGTACLVWSSPLSACARSPMGYIKLIGEQKPHLLIKVDNNLGGETRVQYAPSTKFYLRDKQAGRDWITRLHFPVHVIERVETIDHVSRTRFASRYAYHHGYFDGQHEREFRGFALVEQWDTEEFKTLVKLDELDTDFPPLQENINIASHVPPVYTKTWFHTGAYLERHSISNFFAGLSGETENPVQDTLSRYYREPGLAEDANGAAKFLLADTVLEENWNGEEQREACRALKGQMLRQEVYSLDDGPRSEYPYTVTEQNFTVRRIQPRQDQPHAVFFVHPREAINYHYERNPDDPRVSHSVTLQVDDYGNVQRALNIAYGRRPKTGVQWPEEQTRTHMMLSSNRVANEADQDDWYRVGVPVQNRSYEVVGYQEPEISQGRILPYQFETLLESINTIWPEQQKDPANAKLLPYENWDWRRDNRLLDEFQNELPVLRLIEEVRVRYRPNEMGEREADPLFLLPLGRIASLALPGESYQLAFTNTLLQSIYTREGQELLPGDDIDALMEEAGFRNIDNQWWQCSGRVFYNSEPNSARSEKNEAKDNFYLPRRFHDAFHRDATHPAGPWSTESRVEYDHYNLLVQETKDALENRVTIGERDADNNLTKGGNDYRTLQPCLISDPNRNRSEVRFNTLGLVVGSAIMGKPEESPQKGDLLDDSFIANLTREKREAFYNSDDPHQFAQDQTLLAKATSRTLYDLHSFHRSRNEHPEQPDQWQPVWTASIAREIHHFDPGGDTSNLQISFSYADGLGREIQKKVQAEDGTVPERDAQGRIRVDAENQPILTTEIKRRWVGSGWTVLNNKGAPVQQFEPFFTDTHQPDFDTKIGVSPVLFYDPLKRAVVTLHPNKTYEKVIFDPWKQQKFDVNDTVKWHPGVDGNTKPYVEKYLDTLTALNTPWTTWLQQHNVDPNNPPGDTAGANPERDAAVRTLTHADTPTTVHLDSLGRTFLSEAHNGFDDHGNPILYPTQTVVDIENNTREVIDKITGEAFANGLKHRTVMRYNYAIFQSPQDENGEATFNNRVHQQSMEAGARWVLNDIAGNPVRRWDSRGHIFKIKYDQLRRPIEQWVLGTDTVHSDDRTLNNEILFEKTEYGETFSSDLPENFNLRTRVYRQYDGAGVITNKANNPDTSNDEAYDFKGNLLRSTRTLCKIVDIATGQPKVDQIPDWSGAPVVDEQFDTATKYDALNRPVEVISPDKSVYRPTFNKAALLEKVAVNIKSSATATPFVTNIDYDAKGQRVFIQCGNQAETYYRYDKKTYRLTHLYTRRGAQYQSDCGLDPNRFVSPVLKDLSLDIPCGIQNLRYVYDPAGNITHIEDKSQPLVYFDNACIDASNDYEYDPLYRLKVSVGREHVGDGGRPEAFNRSREGHGIRNDCQALRRYVEKFEYDEVGNILEMVHHQGDHLLTPGTVLWRRRYQYATFNNQLRSTSQPGDGQQPYYSDDDGELYGDQYQHDPHGNMCKMPHLQGMKWDFKDQLLATTKQVVNDDAPPDKIPETTWYVYDGGGQRVRKVTVRQNNTVKNERVYLGGYEKFRKFNGSYPNEKLIRESLHIMDDKQRIALVETKTLDQSVGGGSDDNDELDVPVVRYQVGNHLGSSCVELDRQGAIISYEEYFAYGGTAYHARDKGVRAAGKRYRYSGKERDEESGFYYYGARYYFTSITRWISCDPDAIAHSHNLYEFSSLSPIVFEDTDGRAPKARTLKHAIIETWEAVAELVNPTLRRAVKSAPRGKEFEAPIKDAGAKVGLQRDKRVSEGARSIIDRIRKNDVDLHSESTDAHIEFSLSKKSGDKPQVRLSRNSARRNNGAYINVTSENGVVARFYTKDLAKLTKMLKEAIKVKNKLSGGQALLVAILGPLIANEAKAGEESVVGTNRTSKGGPALESREQSYQTKVLENLRDTTLIAGHLIGLEDSADLAVAGVLIPKIHSAAALHNVEIEIVNSDAVMVNNGPYVFDPSTGELSTINESFWNGSLGELQNQRILKKNICGFFVGENGETVYQDPATGSWQRGQF